MFFASDNTGPVHPKVMEALQVANDGYHPSYGDDVGMAALEARFQDIFEAPQARVFLVATGTAANALILATMAKPWQQILCTDVAHIVIDEANAPEFFAGGARVLGLPSEDAKLAPDTLSAALANIPEGDVHCPQPGALSLTQVTERGTLYATEELTALTGLAKARGMGCHLDGARFANALVALGCSPAEMSWKAGIDAISFGGTKNGLMGVEAIVLFDPDMADECEVRRKRGAQLFSKHRYLAAQMAAYLADDLWLDMAQASNAAAKQLADGLRALPHASLLHEPQANMIFAGLPRATLRKVMDAGATLSPMGDPTNGPEDEIIGTRLVCDWSATTENTDRFLALLNA